MKKLILFLLCISPLTFYGQYRSWDGYQMKPEGKYYVLNIFINVIYDVHPEKDPCASDGNTDWPTARQEGVNSAPVPGYLLDFMDTAYHSDRLRGNMTRVYGEASFDKLQIVGDFMVVNIKESRVLSDAGKFDCFAIAETAVNYVNETGGLRTLYGHNDPRLYDTYGKKEFYFTQILIRNISYAYGGLSGGSGYGESCMNGRILKTVRGNYTLGSKGTFQCVGSGDFAYNPTNIVSHEISHSLFGSNAFHTSGGNHRGSSELMPFLTIQNGYGLMGSSGSGLVGCNGYERWRMHWKSPSSPAYISCRKENNTGSCPSDVSRANGNSTFLLRDFLTYGDVIRIKLPYKDSEKSSNQYIWLENHKVGSNGKLDFLQYANRFSCRPQGQAGIYAYYQIGRDVLEGSRDQVWYNNERDNLKIIPAEGYYNYAIHFLHDTVYRINCVNYKDQKYYHIRQEANPYNGYQDQESQFHPRPGTNCLSRDCEYSMWRKVIRGRSVDSLVSLGDMRDAFSTHTKISMATNPSTCNTRVYYNTMQSGGSVYKENERNVRSTYLSGLSIEMLPQANRDVLVRIRWDDYDIQGTVYWTGRIVLKEKAFVKPSAHIYLTQNLTPEQPYRDETTGLFAPRTVFVCESGSEFVLEDHSALSLESGSRVILKSGSTFAVSEKAKLDIPRGCTFEVEEGAILKISPKAKIKCADKKVLSLLVKD